MKRYAAIVATVLVMAAVIATPATAFAFQLTGGAGTQTQNPYGLWFAGQEACAQEGCHSAIAAKPSPHSEMVTNVKAYPDLLEPAPTSSLWPFVSTLSPWTLKPRDMYLQVGDSRGFHEYIGGVTSVVASGTLPADDLTLWDGMTGYADRWDPAGAKVTPKGYSQSCSDCHNLGVTRPSDKTYILASGATMTTTTPSSASGFGIQCEVCHGTGKNPNGHKTGVPSVVAGTQILKAQVCGQCHVSGTTPEKNISAKAFGNANGYTTDATLSAFLTPYTTIESETTFMNYVNNGGTKPKFLPNGDNFSMNHGYYNEWLNTGHKNSPRSSAMTSTNGTRCMRCHSGLGFLYRIDAKSPQGKRIVATEPSTVTVAASDPGISCQICHTGHVGYTATGYDSVRRWGNGKPVTCEDCHNWRYEQLELPLQYETINGVEYSRPALNNRPHPPQRELWSGGKGGDDGKGGMWGVPAMGQKMTGVTCQDCHMPRTYRESAPVGDDGATERTRMSHRFMVVTPGDAMRWKVRAGGDSCGVPGCHKEEAADYTRTDFQNWMDETSATVVQMTREASASLGIVGADYGFTRYRSFESTQPTSGVVASLDPATWSMLQHAAQNVEFIVADKSNGIHNKDYAIAGLRKALMWAKAAGADIDATIGAGPANGEGMTVSGSLLGTQGAVPDAVVALQSSANGGTSWTMVATASPDATSGAFSIPTGRIVGSQLFRCAFSADASNTILSDVMSVQVPVTVGALSPALAQGGWVDAPSVLVTLTATPGSLTFYSLSGATTLAQTLYTGEFPIVAEGNTTVAFWSSDANGVEAVQSLPVRIDRGAPVLSCDAASSYAEKAVVKATASDPGAGIASLRYSLDGSVMATASGSWEVVTVMTPGSHTLIASATDLAGHVSTKSWSFSLRVTPKVAEAPSSYSSTIGVGKTWTTSCTLTSSGGARIGGKTVYLQRSSNGKSWSTFASSKTNSAGVASRKVKMTSRGTSYWRWYASPDSRCFSAVGGRKKVVAR